MTMNPLHPLSTFSYSSNPASSDAVEMLQTDVMRFFAILCLCLMAIFALVKALPLAESDRPTIAEPANLRQEVESLQIQIASLKKKQAEIKTRTQFASMDAEQAALQAREAAEDERAVLRRLQDTQDQLKQASASLNQARSKLKTRELKLAGIIDDINQKQQYRSELKAQIANESQKLQNIQTSLEQTDREVRRHQAQPAADEQPATTPPEPSEPEGHVLRFASDAALQSLISAGRVDFYAVAGQQAWRLRLADNRVRFISSQNPRTMYEMEPATVPPQFSAAFKQQVAAFGRLTVTWGVTLPSRTTADIQKIVNSRRGGELVIMADGKVSIQ
jgi:hypothetical protein